MNEKNDVLNTHQNKDIIADEQLYEPQTEYKIGKFAQFLGVTPDFLKHYEQYGILHSNVYENNYRYYAFSQASALLAAVQMRNSGFAVKEIPELLNQDDRADIIKKIHTKSQELELQIDHLQAVLEELRQSEEWLKRRDTDPDSWYIIQSETYYFLPHTSGRDFLEDPNIYEILKYWTNWIPVVKSCAELNYDKEHKNFHKEYQWGLIIPKSFAVRYQIPTNEAVKIIPSQKVLIFNFSYSLKPTHCTQHSINEASYHSKLLTLIESMGLSISDQIYQVIMLGTKIYSERRKYGFYIVPLKE